LASRENPNDFVQLNIAQWNNLNRIPGSSPKSAPSRVLREGLVSKADFNETKLTIGKHREWSS